jgi:hypothetical protein
MPQADEPDQAMRAATCGCIYERVNGGWRVSVACGAGGGGGWGTLCRMELAVLATLLAVVATLLPTFFFAFMIERPALAPTLPRSPLFFGVVSPSAMAAGAFLLVCAKRWFCAAVRRWRVQLQHSVVGRFVREMRHTCEHFA